MPTELQHGNRVKLYRRDKDGAWDDKGTGFATVEYDEAKDSFVLLVLAEDEMSRPLMVHRIRKDITYCRQGEETIIQWADVDYSSDVALSFQEAFGCNNIWDNIARIQSDSHLADSPRPQGEFPEGEASAFSDMPPPEMSRLEDLAKQCEDLEDIPGLSMLYRVMKGLIMLNDAALLEELFSKDNVMDVVGCLEYDPDLPQQQRHREFLRDSVVFKEVVGISDPIIIAKIHLTYRIQYVKDVILPRALDDVTFATLSSVALFNSIDIVTSLHQDAQFLTQLFIKLKRHSPQDPEWHDLVAFLQEFCSLAKQLQPAMRQQLFTKLCNLGMFEVVTKVLRHSSTEVKLRASDVLMSAMQHDPSPLRNFIFHQKDHDLFTLLIREMTDGQDGGLPEQIFELLKMLLDPETMEQQVGRALALGVRLDPETTELQDLQVEKNEFLELFYDKYMEQLVAALAAPGQRHTASVLGLIVELLSFCVQHHSYRIKYYILRNNVVDKVLKLLKRREKWLVVATVRFFRACVALKDEFYNRYLIRNNLFKPIMDEFFANGERYNLLNSTVLDMVEFIRKENLKVLMAHLVENFMQHFDQVTYVETFKQLKLKYDQGLERGEHSSADADGSSASSAASNLRGRSFNLGGPPDIGPRRRRGDRELDRDEEDYFSSDDLDELDGMATGRDHGSRDMGRRDGGSRVVGPSTPGPGRGHTGVRGQPQGQHPMQQDVKVEGRPEAKQDGAGGAGGRGAAAPAAPAEWRAMFDYGDDEDEDDEDRDGKRAGGAPGDPNANGKHSPGNGDLRKRLRVQ